MLRSPSRRSSGASGAGDGTGPRTGPLTRAKSRLAKDATLVAQLEAAIRDMDATLHTMRAWAHVARAAQDYEREAHVLERQTLNRRVVELERALAARDDMLARMHQERERAEATVAAAVQRLVAERASSPVDESVCMVCFEPTERAARICEAPSRRPTRSRRSRRATSSRTPGSASSRPS